MHLKSSSSFICDSVETVINANLLVLNWSIQMYTHAGERQAMGELAYLSNKTGKNEVSQAVVNEGKKWGHH